MVPVRHLLLGLLLAGAPLVAATPAVVGSAYGAEEKPFTTAGEYLGVAR